jgi:putative transposase
MSAQWRTAREWAALALPGVPGTERGVRFKADSEGWCSRPRAGSGGGREFHISALPPEARAELISRQVQAQPAAASLPAIASTQVPALIPTA